MARRKTDMIQFKIRMLEELRKRLEVSAKTERRSLNAEIVARLEQSFGQPLTFSSMTQGFLDGIVEKLMSSDDLEDDLRWFRVNPTTRAVGEMLSRELYGRAGTKYQTGQIAEGDRLRLMALALAGQEPELPMPHQSKGE
jgi:hypothetical protein